MGDRDHLTELERHYRPSACRSTTPFFCERRRDASALSHAEDEAGEPYRTLYQHDRDKVLYSPSFRRLRLKTQIFPEHVEDRCRTRLDHTLEVAQIARHLARQMQLNEDLVDAIALAHDLGHAPFGHSGERALHRILRNIGGAQPGVLDSRYDGFKRNWQGLRTVDVLEKAYPSSDGLNLTNAVRVGILLHTSLEWRERDFADPEDRRNCTCEMGDQLDFDPRDDRCRIFEVQVCSLADEIAQVIHDLEDGLMSRSIALESLVGAREDWPLVAECMKSIEGNVQTSGRAKQLPQWADLSRMDFSHHETRSLFVSRIRSELIYQLSLDATRKGLKELCAWERDHLGAEPGEGAPKHIEAFNDYVRNGNPLPKVITLDDYASRFKELEERLLHTVIATERVSRMDAKAERVLQLIFGAYVASPRQVPDQVLEDFGKSADQGSVGTIRAWPADRWEELMGDKQQQACFVRAAADHIAQMTDRSALREFDLLHSAYPRQQQ